MDEKDIIRSIADVNFWGKEIDTGIPRPEYTEKVRKFAGSGEAVVVMGPRRSGKTTICLQVLREMIANGMDKAQTLYVNFEDPALETLLTGPEAMERIYRSYRLLVNRDKDVILVLDEVQNVPRWEKWVRSMHEKKEAKIIVTGSSSRLLSSEIATVLTGRTLSVFVFPLGFGDFLRFRGVQITEAYEAIAKENEVKGLLLEYMEFGGFPKVVIEQDPLVKKSLLKEYFDGVVFRDIIQRYRIKDIQLIRNLAELCLNGISSLTSANRMREALIRIVGRKISGNKVVDFMGHLESSFLMFFVPIFSYKVKEQKLYPKKAYAVDAGLANAVAFKFSDDTGRMAENIVFLHLKKLALEKNLQLFYWRDEQQREVDFVVKQGLKATRLIQVCWDVRGEKARERENRILAKACEAFGLKEGVVVTGDFEGEETLEGRRVRYVPIWKFLLEPPE